MPPHHNPIRFREAWDAIRILMRDPDDTAQVFRIIRALSGNSQERAFQRFLRSENGPKILAEKRVLLDTLSDRAYLESLPQGTLGRAYADFTAREQITADGLVDASESAPRDDEEVLDPRRVLFGQRVRDSHDLWHVVTGYGRDLFGEAALLSFTYRQIRNRGVGFIVAVAYLKSRGAMAGERVMIRDGFRRAGRAEWLPGADWEALLERPLDEVRRTLGVEPIESYEGLRSEGAPALA
ncbi:MAG: Coq4 family protein [Myxococcota bacterium]